MVNPGVNFWFFPNNLKNKLDFQLDGKTSIEIDLLAQKQTLCKKLDAVACIQYIEKI